MSDEPDFSVDAYHRGRFVLVQPRHGGHRAGMDALVLAAAVPTGFSGTVADFGAGAGAVGLAVGSRCEKARIVLVEKSLEMARFAEMTLAHGDNRPIAARAVLVVADLSLGASERETSGLARDSADFILMNPPFNDSVDRATPSALRRAAHVMEDGLFEDWVRAAAGIARAHAGIAIIARPSSLADVLSALSRRFGSAELVAVHARANEAAIRIVVRARRGARGGLSITPPLVLQEANGQTFTARAEAINAGAASLFGD